MPERRHDCRFGLASGEADILAWLIENHLLMTATAFKRDMEDDKTIDDFAAVVADAGVVAHESRRGG